MFNDKAIVVIKENLIRRNEKVSVAESVTAGLLQAALASGELALKFFEGGITTYNIDQKVRHLNIDRRNGEACNCVSEQTANEMARGVCVLFGTDWGISVTGYATAVPESNFKLFAYFSFYHKGEVVLCERVDLEKQGAEAAQIKFVNMIVDRFFALLKR